MTTIAPARPPTRATRTVPRTTRSDWLIPLGLILLAAVPVVAGAFRLVELGSGAEITPDNARFFASPIPGVIHIVGATLYALLGALQFSPGIRRRATRASRIVRRLA